MKYLDSGYLEVFTKKGNSEEMFYLQLKEKRKISGIFSNHIRYVLMFALLMSIACGNSVSVVDPIEEWKGIVASYPLDGNGHDASGNGHHGSPAAGASFSVEDRHGNSNSALYVGSDDSYITILNNSQLEVQEHTISAWVKQTQSGNNGEIFNNGGVGLIDHYALRAYDHMLSHIIEYDDPGFDHIYNTTVLSDGDWHHILETYDGSLSDIWVDGVLMSSYNRGVSIQYDTHYDCYIGMNFPGGHDWFEGAIDDVRLFDRVLSENEINTLSSE